MRRLILTLTALSFVATAAFAVDPGRAEGAIIVDGNRIPLVYAYAVGHQSNEVTNRKDDMRIVLTDKPLPDATKLEDIDYSFPDGTYGMVVCVSHDDKVSHVVVQHAKGLYDGGYFESDPSYTFHRTKSNGGPIAGTLSAKSVTTNTMTFSFDVEFDAAAR
ncbi:MAG TPA: hypothetical protein VL284_12545 [Thermoanaerobaculia bacterium]|nr:hypothetical protein [Thermoanaerobaculia bacterium]